MYVEKQRQIEQKFSLLKQRASQTGTIRRGGGFRRLLPRIELHCLIRNGLLPLLGGLRESVAHVEGVLKAVSR